ncbi:trypsin alpha-like [Aphidius gifuensis]|nr:trypsin alpha-like [Aphidius gifuensis]
MRPSSYLLAFGHHPLGLLKINPGAFKNKSLSGNKTAINIDSLSFLVSLRRNGKHDCQGSIIASNLIIAPAHCVNCEATSNPDLQVLAGTNNFNNESSGKLYKVSNITCNELNPNDNIAFLTLSQNISTNQRTISLQGPRQQTIKDNDRTKKYLVGWGLTENNSKAIEKIETAAKNSCFRELHKLNLQNYICTPIRQYDICKNNSDAVLISNNTIIGMPTKIGCSNENRKFNIFTRVELLFHIN